MIILRKKAPPPSGLIPNVVFNFVGLTVNAGSLANVTNGSGLTPAIPSLSGVHENYTTANSVRSAINSIWPRILLFTLPAAYQVNGLSFWQVTGGNEEYFSGIKNFTLEYSLNNSVWLPIPQSPTTFPLGSPITPSNPLQFSWNPVNAAFIRFIVTSNWGGIRIALSEVQFSGYLS